MRVTKKGENRKCMDDIERENRKSEDDIEKREQKM